MTDSKVNEPAEYTRKLRSRKSGALSDISNRIVAGIDAATRRVTAGTNKRKLPAQKSEQRRKSSRGTKSDDGGDAETTVNEDDTVAVDNPMAEANTSMTSCSSSSAASDAANLDNSIARTSDASENQMVNIEDLNPNKIRRTFPLRMRYNDPAQCMGLLDDMYEIYYENETKYQALAYMQKQQDLNNKMRSILVDWLVEVHYKFKLQTATLYLCINLIDRYLNLESILRGKLQLVGVAALFIACKFEEVYPPEVRDFVYITDNAYNREQVLKMETSILTALNYEVLVPTVHHFLSRYLNCIRASERTRLVANYYSERNLQEAIVFDYSPRVYAAAAVYAALKQQNCQYPNVLGQTEIWTLPLREESNLVEDDLIECAKQMVHNVGEETQTTSKRKLIAAKKKYSVEKFQKIAELPLPTFD